MTERRRLADYVEPELSEARILAQWSRLRESESRRRSWQWGYAFAGMAVAVVLVAFSVRQFAKTDVASSELTVDRASNGQERVRLPEGISVVVAKDGKLELRKRSDSEIVLALLRGEADFDVTHHQGRRVIVSTPRVDVEVVGTRFHVAVTGSEAVPDVAVRVERGTVKVRSNRVSGRPVEERRLTTGEAWSSSVVPQSFVASSTAPESAPSSEAKDVTAAASSVERVSARNSAKELFESAERFRLGGRLRDAAAALDALRRQYPGDSRAALAAFELGRIRMDGLGDFAGAATAFESALKLNPSASFREDAEARLVSVYDRMGQRTACESSRRAYLARYPRGSHVNSVGRACGH